MADVQTQATPTSSADVANAKQLNQAISNVIQNVGSNTTAIVTALTSIATAITNSLIGGSTGTTANRLLRAKGTGARALQNSPVGCDDSGNLTGVGTVTVSTAGGFRTGTSAGNTALLQAYDVDGTSYTTFATLTANNTPTFDLASGTTLNSVGIATLNTNTWLQQQGFPQATLTAASTVTWNGQTQQTAKITLDGTTTALGAISNAVAGFTYILEIVQDGTGGRALALSNAAYTWPGGTVPSISTAANAVDVMTCYYDGSKMRCTLQKAFA